MAGPEIGSRSGMGPGAGLERGGERGAAGEQGGRFEQALDQARLAGQHGGALHQGKAAADSFARAAMLNGSEAALREGSLERADRLEVGHQERLAGSDPARLTAARPGQGEGADGAKSQLGEPPARHERPLAIREGDVLPGPSVLREAGISEALMRRITDLSLGAMPHQAAAPERAGGPERARQPGAPAAPQDAQPHAEAGSPAERQGGPIEREGCQTPLLATPIMGPGLAATAWPRVERRGEHDREQADEEDADDAALLDDPALRLRHDPARARGLLRLRPGDDMVAFHVIPPACVARHRPLFTALAELGWCLDTHEVLIALPASDARRRALEARTGECLPVRRGAHPGWTVAIEAELAELAQLWRRRRLDAAQVLAELRSLQRQLKATLMLRPVLA